MNRIYYAMIIAVLFSACTPSLKNPKGVVIEMYSPDLPDTTRVYITGSIAQLGNWNPSAVPMEYQGDHLWRFIINGEWPALIEYKFTLGSWSREAAGANGLPLQNLVLKPKGDTVVKNNINFWLDGKPRVTKGQVTGQVRYHGPMHGKGLLDRSLVVWLPPQYDAIPDSHYPVLYMHDGQNLFDPATSSFGVDWQIDETLDSLAKTGNYQIPIVVGIENTVERTPDYTPGKQNKDYMRFVVEEVKPFIDSVYRTLPDRENTSVGGSSYGGLVSFMMAWEYPDVFSKAYCLSPAFKIQRIDYVKNVLDTKQHKDLTFYIDNGGVGLEEQLQPGVDAMIAALKKKGYRENQDFFVVIDPKARHFESDWAKRMPRAFELMLKPNEQEREKANNDL